MDEEPPNLKLPEGPVNVLVTGGTGFFGHNLILALLAHSSVNMIHVYARRPPPTENLLSRWDALGGSLMGHPVEPTSENERVLQSAGPNAVFANDRVRVFRGHITDRVRLKEAMAGCHIVFHACGDTRWWNAINSEQYATNVEGTKVAFEVAESCPSVKRFIYTSTVDVMGHDDCPRDVMGYPDNGSRHPNTTGVLDETHPRSRYSYTGFGYHYADTKRQAEEYLLSTGSCMLTIIRPGSMLGPWDVSDQYGRLFAELKQHSLAGIPSGGTSFCHVQDVARAHIKAAFRPVSLQSSKNPPIYICAGENVTYRQLFYAMRAMLKDYHDDNSATIGVCCGGCERIPRWLLVVYAWCCERHSNLWSGEEPELNPGMARYMSCHAYYSSAKAERDLGYPPQAQRWLAAIVESYEWYRVRGRF